ncbi:MAG: TonB-dependent receptor [Sulfurospirillum sp.]|nr:TonB-dependent receptor [Sulfurospirillum sp.]
MKYPKGFRGRYFSLAAILALSTTITLANETQSFTDSKKDAQVQEEFDKKEELTPPADELAVAIISKKIRGKNDKIYSASKNSVSKTNITDNVSILTSEEIQLQGFTTLKDALNSLAGISVTSTGGLGQSASIFMQGLSNKYLLVLVDGVRYNDPSNTSGARLETLFVGDIEKIEVIKGAQSGIWGADAAAGVVNIITKKAKAGTHIGFGSEIGSYGYKSADLSLSHRTRTLDALISVLRITSDGFTSYMPKGDNLDDYEDDSFRSTTLNFKSGYWLDSNNKVQLGYHEINSLNHYDQDYMDGNSIGRADYKGQSGNLGYKHYNGKNLLEASITQNKFHYRDLDLVFSPWYEQIVDTKGSTPFFELKDTYTYAKDSLLGFGVNYEKRAVKYTVLNGIEKEKNDHSKAAFLNNTYRYENFIFSQALRFDQFSNFKNKMTGKFGVKYLFAENVNIYANYGTAYKTPNIIDMTNPWGVSNFNLKPENIKSFNAGFAFQGLEGNYFRNEIKDMIQWVSSQNVNVEGNSILQGFELSYQKTFFDTLLLGTNYTYTDAKDKNNNRLDKISRHQMALNASYALAKDLLMNANGSFVGSRKEGTQDTGRYFVANTKVDYRINKTFSTYVKVENLFDREYQTTNGYATPRRSFFAGFKATF